jgi:hypothetical protein
MINTINKIHPTQFRVRFSDDWSTEFSAHVIQPRDLEYVEHGVICPEQLGKTESCASCGYCWASDNPVVFIEH